MELATPLMPTSLLTNSTSPPHVFYSSGQPQSFHDSGHGLSQGQVLNFVPGSRHTDSFYVDPPSIPLPPSPDGLSAWEENSEFTVSASAFPLPPPFTPRFPLESNSRYPTIAVEDRERAFE